MIDPATAKAIIVADYAKETHAGQHTMQNFIRVDGIDASLWSSEAGDLGLCCTGSNDGWDWARNLNPFPAYSEMGASGAWYRKGFIEVARSIYIWTLEANLSWIIGHSAGAASGGIVGASREVPTICFATPKQLLPRQRQLPGARLVRNLLLGCDPVWWMPITYGHVGGVRRQSCDGWWLKHAMVGYPGSGWGEMGWPED